MKRSTRRAAAFSLVEVTMAIGIVAFATLVIVSLLPIGLKSQRIGTDELAALTILGALEADLRLANSSKSPLFAIDRQVTNIQGAPSPIFLNSDGSPVTAAGDATYRLIVENLTPLPALPTPADTYRCRAKVSWPAGASVREDGKPETSAGQVEVYLAMQPQ